MKSQKNQDQAEFPRSGKDSRDGARSGASDKSAKGSNRRRRGGNRSSGQKGAASTSTNRVISNAEIETPISTPSLVFPSASASMAAFGNYTTTPGQLNFIGDANIVHHDAWHTDTELNVTCNSWDAMRTLNTMVLYFTPLYGCVNSDNFGLWENPVMLACMNIKQYCDTSFGTNTDYHPTELGVYLMAVAAVFPKIAEIKRAIRLAVTYLANQFPQFIPRGLFAALRISDDEGNFANGEGALYAAKHLRSYIDQLNQLIISFNRLPMPPEFALFGYNDDLLDHIYLDSPDVTTAQTYLFQPYGYWLYDEAASMHGSQLMCIEGTGPRTIEAQIAILGEMIERISVLRTDSAAMLQNMFNAYGSRDMITIPTLDYATLQPLDFVYDEHILTAIENAVICGDNEVNFSAIQADNAAGNINFHIWLDSAAKPAPAIEIPLQFHKPYDQITREDVGYALRFHPSFRDQKKFSAWENAHQEPTEYSHVTADNYCPFALIRGVNLFGLSDTAEIYVVGTTTRRLQTGDSWNYFTSSLDFSARPVMVELSIEHHEGEPYYVNVNKYSAERDVECTYRLEDMHMYWIYLTTDIYGANINRNVTGSRTRA